ncbi:MAG TPA: PAS domain S-box protein [Gemmatimonadales bacterium]
MPRRPAKRRGETSARPGVEDQLRRALSLLTATLESTADGILVVDRGGRMVSYNQKFARMWRIPQSVIVTGKDDAALAFVLDQLADPQGFLNKVRELYATPAAESFDVLEFKDGRVFERYSQPQRVGAEVAGRVWSFRDVTQRRRAEEAIRRREAQLAAAQAVAHLGVWEWDMVKNRVSWSDEIYRIYGLAPRKNPLTFERIVELVVPEDRERTRVHLEAAVERAREAFRTRGAREGPVPPLDYRITRPDGTVRTLYGSGQVALDGGGDPARMMGIVLDLTERKLTEEALAASEGRLRAIFDAEPECVKLVAPDGRLLDMNPAGLAMIEASSLEQVRGSPVIELIAPEHREAYTALHQRVVQGQSGMLEYEIVGLSGGRRWMETHAAPLRGWQGAVVAHLAVTRDVTQRRQAETALRHREREYRTLLEQAADAIFVSDQSGRFLEVNRRACELTGYTREELLRLTNADTYVPEERGEAAARLAVLRKGEPVTWERRLLRKDGSTVMAEFSGSMLPDGRFQGFVRDITERKRVERELQTGRRRLRDLSGRLRDAHEEERARIARELHDQLGQTLTAIKLSLQAIERWVGGAAPAVLAEGIQLVDGALQQVRTMSFDLRPAVLDDLGLAAALRSYARRHATTAGLDLRLHIAPRIDGASKEVETACFRIAQEAITNVVRHARARRLDVTLRRVDGTVELGVQDDGVGLPAARDSGGAPGAELGFLSMQERAVAAGGGLEVESGREGGTTVRVRFPLGPPVEAGETS